MSDVLNRAIRRRDEVMAEIARLDAFVEKGAVLLDPQTPADGDTTGEPAFTQLSGRYKHLRLVN